ncbi:MAG: WYL domain-containing protein [Vagococcus sp.]|uniref:helix-turn-helix transcriptional regulator n=1 Tax=Vagococcus sp. TaxID=1933889 RepID=UPI002FC6BCF9
MKKAERLNQELIFLKDKKTFQLKDLMDEFQISKRTALRDVQELESMGLALYTEYGRSGKYQLLKQHLLTPIYFNETEIQAIFFALKALTLVSSTPFDHSYKRIKEKMFETLPELQKQKIENILSVVSYHNVSPINEVKSLAYLLEAILDRKILKITYTQFEEEVIYIQLFDLFYRQGIWFCNGYNVAKKKWGVFRCDYMEKIALSDKVFKTYAEDEMSIFLNDYETKFHDISFKCRLTPYGKELFLKRNYPNMSLKIEDGISYIVGAYNDEHLPFLVQYLVSLGKHVTIEYPEKLKQCYLEELKTIISFYKN